MRFSVCKVNLWRGWGGGGGGTLLPGTTFIHVNPSSYSLRASEKVEEREEPSGLGKIDLVRYSTTIVRRHAELIVNKPDPKSDLSTLPLKNTKKTKREFQSPLVSTNNILFLTMVIVA